MNLRRYKFPMADTKAALSHLKKKLDILNAHFHKLDIILVSFRLFFTDFVLIFNKIYQLI